MERLAAWLLAMLLVAACQGVVARLALASDADNPTNSEDGSSELSVDLLRAAGHISGGRAAEDGSSLLWLPSSSVSGDSASGLGLPADSRAETRAVFRPRCMDGVRLRRTLEGCNYGDYRSIAAGVDCFFYGYNCSKSQEEADAIALQLCELRYPLGGGCSLVLQDTIQCADASDDDLFDAKYGAALQYLSGSTGPGRWWAFGISAGCEVGAAAVDHMTAEGARKATLDRCAEGSRALNYGPQPCTVVRLEQVPLPAEACSNAPAWQDLEETAKNQTLSDGNGGYYAVAITKDCRAASGVATNQPTLQAALDEALRVCTDNAINVQYGDNGNGTWAGGNVTSSGNSTLPSAGAGSGENAPATTIVNGTLTTNDTVTVNGTVVTNGTSAIDGLGNSTVTNPAVLLNLCDVVASGGVAPQPNCSSTDTLAPLIQTGMQGTDYNKWFAVARDITCSYAGLAYNQPSRALAQSRALRQCEQNGTYSNCTVVLSQTMECSNSTIWAAVQVSAATANKPNKYWAVAVDKLCRYVTQAVSMSTADGASSAALRACNAQVGKRAKNQCAVVARGGSPRSPPKSRRLLSTAER